jgi:hypothetical protein
VVRSSTDAINKALYPNTLPANSVFNFSVRPLPFVRSTWMASTVRLASPGNAPQPMKLAQFERNFPLKPTKKTIPAAPSSIVHHRSLRPGRVAM